MLHGGDATALQPSLHHADVLFLCFDFDITGLLEPWQEVSLQDVRKEISFCHKVKLPIIGVVENMSSFTCPKCQVRARPTRSHPPA